PSLVQGTGDAYPTSRVLEGSSDHGYAEEWAEPAMLPDGTECYRMYLFADDEVIGEDGEPLEPDMLPWDDEHVARIKIA
ncbi:MAG: hypothetical protein Q8R16_00950, partial [bacterium]|nr:hypothetical protein [bacterium]